VRLCVEGAIAWAPASALGPAPEQTEAIIVTDPQNDAWAQTTEERKNAGIGVAGRGAVFPVLARTTGNGDGSPIVQVRYGGQPCWLVTRDTARFP
jgi:hypothetical protein